MFYKLIYEKDITSETKKKKKIYYYLIIETDKTTVYL